MKIIWAPLVDALYIQRIGRRKTWLISVMYLMGTYIMFHQYEVIHKVKNYWYLKIL